MPHAAPVRNGKKRGATCGIHAAPVRNEKKRGQRVGFTRPRLNKNSPPPTTGRDNGARTRRRVVLTPPHSPRWLLERKKGRRGHEQPPPPQFPCILVPPSLASSLPFPSSSLLLAPYLLISAPVSLEEGRGGRCDVAGLFVDADLAAGVVSDSDMASEVAGVGDVAFGGC